MKGDWVFIAALAVLVFAAVAVIVNVLIAWGGY